MPHQTLLKTWYPLGEATTLRLTLANSGWLRKSLPTARLPGQTKRLDSQPKGGLG